MALPKKNARSITINEVKYRFTGWVIHYEEGELFVELFNNPRQKIKATFTWEKIYEEYKKVNHRISTIIDMPPSYIVRQTILYALKTGWHPDSGGGILNLGNLDDKIDYTLMKPQNGTAQEVWDETEK